MMRTIQNLRTEYFNKDMTILKRDLFEINMEFKNLWKKTQKKSISNNHGIRKKKTGKNTEKKRKCGILW